jgi:hypothetical protein
MNRCPERRTSTRPRQDVLSFVTAAGSTVLTCLARLPFGKRPRRQGVQRLTPPDP